MFFSSLSLLVHTVSFLTSESELRLYSIAPDQFPFVTDLLSLAVLAKSFLNISSKVVLFLLVHFFLYVAACREHTVDFSFSSPTKLYISSSHKHLNREKTRGRLPNGIHQSRVKSYEVLNLNRDV